MTPLTELLIASILLAGGGASSYKVAQLNREIADLQTIIDERIAFGAERFRVSVSGPGRQDAYNQYVEASAQIANLSSGRDRAERDVSTYLMTGTVSYTMGGFMLLKAIYDYKHQPAKWARGLEIKMPDLGSLTLRYTYRWT
jgi:chaperonin GroEL (HSP60 family)